MASGLSLQHPSYCKLMSVPLKTAVAMQVGYWHGRVVLHPCTKLHARIVVFIELGKLRP